jgi:DMSO/TMAO reductase YedYZ molybdopterin-dependent catalytic subunit
MSAELDALQVTGRVASPRSFTREELVALPSVTQTVTFVSRPDPRTTTFTGVRLLDLVKAAGGLKLEGTHRLERLGLYLLARDRSGFGVTISWGEIDPICANRELFVAYQCEGEPLSPSEGMARLVVPGDAHGARFISQLAELRVCAAES